jgi:hypothetical protein
LIVENRAPGRHLLMAEDLPAAIQLLRETPLGQAETAG